MIDQFVKSEWELLCDHLRQCAGAIARTESDKAEFLTQAEAFADLEPPHRYPDLLKKTADAAELAVRWQQVRGEKTSATESAVHAHEEEMIDEALDESFPASDPPSFSHAHA